MNQKKVWYAPNKFEAYGDEEIEAVSNCLKDGWLAGFMDKSIEFEQRVSKYFSKNYGLFVNSGSSANLLGIASLNIPPGKEVVTPACGFSTTVSPIIQLNLKPIFCDVWLTTYQAKEDDVLSKITENTAVLMLPNLIGNKPNWKYLKEKVMFYTIEVYNIDHKGYLKLIKILKSKI